MYYFIYIATFKAMKTCNKEKIIQGIKERKTLWEGKLFPEQQKLPVFLNHSKIGRTQYALEVLTLILTLEFRIQKYETKMVPKCHSLTRCLLQIFYH